MRFLKLFLLIISAGLIICSCSKGVSTTVPSDQAEQWKIVEIPVSDADLALLDNPYRGVFGAWKVHLDMDNLIAEILPARNAKAIGDIYDADLSQFLTVSPCSNCIGITGMRKLSDSEIVLDIQIRHPFPNIAARPDLHGFDVRAIFIVNHQYTTTSSLTMTKCDGSEVPVEYNSYFVLNADGYTSHYDELVNDPRYFVSNVDCPGNINPYLRFFDDPSTGDFDPHSPAGYNVMPVGSSNYKRSAVLSTSYFHTSTDFFIVADGAYGHSAVLLNRTDPKYFLPSFNRTEPWRMEYWLENNNLTYNNADSFCDLAIQVFDWQHNATVDPNYPDQDNLSGIRESSRVARVEISLPSLLPHPVILADAISGTGTPTNPLLYTTRIKNELLGISTVHTGLVAIRDELYGSESPSGRYPVPEAPAGFPFETQDIRDYAYYGLIYINMPHAQYVTPEHYKNELVVQTNSLYGTHSIRPQVSFFMDPGGGKFLYEWDFDYDGVTFDVDYAGYPCSYIIPADNGKNLIGLRVTTNSVPSRQYVYAVPIYKRGLEYEKQVPPTNDLVNATSTRESNAIHATEDKVYVVFTQRGLTSPNARNIYIAAIDRYSSGEINIAKVTDANDKYYYDPSLYVIETGSNAGIFVVFTERGDGVDDIRFNSGSLDLSGFNHSNIKNITNASLGRWSRQPAIVGLDDKLVVYYSQMRIFPTPQSRIHRVVSNNYGLNWVDDTEIDTGSDSQSNPSVAYVDWVDRVYCVWEDNRDAVTYGTDLYMESWDGGSSIKHGNIIPDRSNADDIQPSVSADDSLLAVAYTSVSGSLSSIKLLTMMGGGLPANSSYIQGLIQPLSVSNPSVSVAAKDQFTVAYSSYNANTQELKSIVRHYHQGDKYGNLSYSIIQDLVMGTIESGGADSFVCVDSRRVASGYAIEHYVARRNFTAGAFRADNPFTMYFGKLDVMCYVSHGDNNNPW